MLKSQRVDDKFELNTKANSKQFLKFEITREWTTNQSVESVNHRSSIKYRVTLWRLFKRRIILSDIHLGQHEKRFSKNITIFRSVREKFHFFFFDTTNIFQTFDSDDITVTRDESKLISKIPKTSNIQKKTHQNFHFCYCFFMLKIIFITFLVIRHKFFWFSVSF